MKLVKQPPLASPDFYTGLFRCFTVSLFQGIPAASRIYIILYLFPRIIR
jgi:hypothetical protein